MGKKDHKVRGRIPLSPILFGTRRKGTGPRSKKRNLFASDQIHIVLTRLNQLDH
jgi:hypothetical protein